MKATAANLVDQTLTHYQLVEKIGAGGMGDVYRAAIIGSDAMLLSRCSPSS